MVMDGKDIKERVLTEYEEKVKGLGKRLRLVVIQVGDDSASNVYIGQKEKMCKRVGYDFVHIKYGVDTPDREIIENIEELNRDERVTGILLQLPLPNGMDAGKVLSHIDYRKDVDGLTDRNMGRLVHRKDCLAPCTPTGIMRMLDCYGIEVQGKNVVIVGRSDLVGKPLFNMMLNRNATVTICHSQTENLADYTRRADILVVAIGHREFITGDMIKDGAVVIDVGINRYEGRLYGDVNFMECKDKASYITPVPGGVGAMTIASLCMNIYKAGMFKEDL